ncbi:MAG: hypothetical protein L3J09_02030 [Flavobacteriaceae bacterium]|nr:hypothetical protein [Flavobacteriaceae bacterium]
MMLQKKRKEVSLNEETIVLLKIQAEKEGRNLKNFMEQILIKKAQDFELSNEYKLMMDEMLEKHKKGELNYAPWEDVKNKVFQK